MTAIDHTAARRWKKISEGFEGSCDFDTPRHFCYGLCYATTGNWDYDADPNAPDLRRLRAFGRTNVDYWKPTPCEGEGRPFRSTVAALIAAMIETGDDPADWKGQT